MAEILTFYDADHKYLLDGEEIPSVSEISRFAAREIYQTVTQYQLDHAADRGTKVHAACENLDRYGDVKVDADVIGYVKAYVKFRNEHPIEYEAIEKRYAGETQFGRYAGTIDRAGVFHRSGESGDTGERAIIDLKTSSALQKVLAAIQLNAYKTLYEQNTGLKVDKLYILHLHADETYKLVEFPTDPTLFNACFALHSALKKKSRKKKETKNDAK